MQPVAVALRNKIETYRFELGGSRNLDLKGYDLDAIVHLARSQQGDEQSRRRATIDGSAQLVDAAIEARVGSLICVSSISVIDYAAHDPLSCIDESSKLQDFTQGKDSYAKLKAEQETIMSRFCSHGSLAIIRPGLVYDDSNLSNAHAGILGNRLALLSSHGGQVPVISVGNLANAIVDIVENRSGNKEIYHLLDDNLPTQAQYLSELRRRGEIPSASLQIPWQLLEFGAHLCRVLLRLVGMEAKSPEALTLAGFAARLKPFQFSAAKAKAVLKRKFDECLHTE
jgi:nucleoside-diphosphate-sugar epimerase